MINIFRKLKFHNNEDIYEIPLVGEEQEATSELGVTKTGEIFNDYYNNKAGFYSHAEGYEVEATGDYSHAEGNVTKAEAKGSHAEGLNTTAKAQGAHAEGIGTIASIEGAHASGTYNIEGEYLAVIGNGTTSTRSNAYSLDKDGNAEFAGKITSNGQIVITAGNQGLESKIQEQARQNLGIINPNEYIYIGADEPPEDSQYVIWINPYSAT